MKPYKTDKGGSTSFTLPPQQKLSTIKVFVERGGFEPPKLLKVTERLPRSPFVLCH